MKVKNRDLGGLEQFYSIFTFTPFWRKKWSFTLEMLLHHSIYILNSILNRNFNYQTSKSKSKNSDKRVFIVRISRRMICLHIIRYFLHNLDCFISSSGLYVFIQVSLCSWLALQSHHDIQVILLLHFFVYIVVDGQDLKAGNHPRPFCSPISCDAKEKNYSCAICHRGKMKNLFKSREECASACK